jgi:phenylacetate-CoA ligase
MRKSQFDTLDATEATHQARLAELLRFAFEHVPYYQAEAKRLGLGIADIEIQPERALLALPLLDKTILRNQLAALKADDLDKRRWYYNTSGGSTGEPARFIQDAAYHQAGQASKALFDEWTGYAPGMPKVVLWGSLRDLLIGKETLRNRLGRYLRNESLLNTFRMTETDLRSFVETINRTRPAQILAYVDSAFELARYIEREGLSVHSPKAVMTSAGTLYPHMREMIERGFAAPVFNRYGSREVGDIACECARHEGLHVNPYTHHVEILRADGTPCAPGEVGEVVVTLLTNFAMPIIRYKIGDMAAWSEKICSCGRAWPLLKEISGRVNSIINTIKGTYSSTAIMPALLFKDTQKLQPFSYFRQFQLVQKKIDLYELRLVLQDKEIWELEKKQVLTNLHKLLGEEVNILIKIMDEIAPSPSGKYQYIWSELS